MKFYMGVNYYLVSLCFKFQKDSCINARARAVNARERFIASVRVYDLCARIYAQISMKFETYAHKIVFDHQLNFHKDSCKDARARGVKARASISSHAALHVLSKCPWVATQV